MLIMAIVAQFGMSKVANERILMESSIDTSPFDDDIIFLSNAHGFNHTTYIPRDQIAHIYNNAVKGSSESGFFVGMFYLYGFMGTEGGSDMENAIKWFSKSAADGFADSQLTLGILLYHKDRKSSMTWIYQAAVSGNHPRAHYLLARSLCEGSSLQDIGVKDAIGESKYQQAVSYLRKAGHIPEALHLLAVLFEYNLVGEEHNGNDSDAHFKEALKLYKLAVSNGSVESLYNLALMYLYGRGTTIDISKATNLLLQAANKDHVPSFRFLGLLAMQDVDQPNPRDAIFWLRKCVKLAKSADLKTVCNQDLEQIQEIVENVNSNHYLMHEQNSRKTMNL
jgi:enhanced entry protein EnhC